MTPGERSSITTITLGADFLHFATTLSEVLEAVAEDPRTRLELDSARDRITRAVSALADGGAIPERSGQELSALIVEIFGRPSATAPQLAIESVLEIFVEVYATIADVIDDPGFFRNLPPSANRRLVRSAVVSMFEPIFDEPGTTRADPLGSLTAAVDKGKWHILRTTRQLEHLQESIGSEEPAAYEIVSDPKLQIFDGSEPRPTILVPTRGSSVLGTAKVEMAVPPVEIVGLHDRIHRIWYGTSRAPVAPTDEAQGFTNQLDTKVHYGYCHVFVPRNHEVATVKTSWIRRLLAVSVGDSLDYRGSFPRSREEFADLMARDLEHWKGARTGLVYVHGYKNSFQDAALRAAQLGTDLEVNGVVSFFSWPSGGKLSDYFRDGETTSFSQSSTHFVEFIETLSNITQLDRIDIIAHSMGNRVLAGSLELLARSSVSRRLSLGHLVLAAPDVSRVHFKQLLPVYKSAVKERVTLYTCKKDRALWGSGKINGYQRIGYEPPVFCDPMIDTVSVSPLKLDALGHSYIGSAVPVLEDLKRLLWTNSPPAERHLDPVPSRGLADYWRIRAPKV